MERVSNWETALADYLAPLMATAELKWGTMDCALFGAGAVLVMTGFDGAAAFRGKYSTATGSVRALKRYGAGSLEATFDAALPERPIGFARRGDLVMYDGAVGVCIGADALFMPREGDAPGLVRIPRALWTKAWAV